MKCKSKMELERDNERIMRKRKGNWNGSRTGNVKESWNENGRSENERENERKEQEIGTLKTKDNLEQVHLLHSTSLHSSSS